MKKFMRIARMGIAWMMSVVMAALTVCAYDFPEPDWGALLSERTSMVTETDFELYVEGNPENAVYYGAKLEPKAGVYLGMTADTSSDFQPLGSYLTYVESFKQADLYYPTNAMVQKDSVVTMVGWTVNSLDSVNYNGIRKLMKKLSTYKKPMFIRFANEMNVSALGLDPDKYIEVFRKAADIVHEYPNFAVVWSPNDIGALDRPFQYYYPGDEYVDWVGVSCYLYKYFQYNPDTTKNDATFFMSGEYAWTTNKLKPIIEFMEEYHINKPLMISEGGVARSNSRGTDYTGWHEPRLRHMLWNTMMKYPQVKMINYFNMRFDNFNGETFYISDSQESVDIFKEAAANGAYLLSADDTPDFVFRPANNGETLVADNGIVRLYTLAYFAEQPDITVAYKLDGKQFFSAKEIPYLCNFELSSVTDGAHTLTITANGMSRDYTLYKSGQSVRFGKDPATTDQTKQEDPSASGNAQASSAD